MHLQVFQPFAFSINESHPVFKLTQAKSSVKIVPYCSTACFLGFFLHTSCVVICTDVPFPFASQIWET